MHSRLTRLGLATARDEHPCWPLQKLCRDGQRRQVTHNYMPARRITGRNAVGVHDAEVNGGGILIPSDTPAAYTMPGVCS